MTQWSNNSRSYARFVPREEVSEVSAWSFGSFGVPAALPEPEPEPVDEAPPVAVIDESVVQAAREDAYRQGFEQGQLAAQEQVQRQMADFMARQGDLTAQRLKSLVDTYEARMAQVEQELAQQVLALACEIARQVVRQELAINPNALLPVIREALDMLVHDGQGAAVRLNPLDLDVLQASLAQEFESHRLSFIADSSVDAGSCQVELAGMVIDGSLTKRWRRAVAALGQQTPWEDAPPAHPPGERDD